MTSEESWQRAQTIFERVRGVPLEQRAAALDSACDSDITMRAEVESLLQHDAQAGQFFLATPEHWLHANVKAWNNWAETLIGTRVGHYTLRRLIASGGMGCVFEAQQEHPARAVAVKILRPGCSAPSAWARFRVEPEILARLRHPNIAQVFEAGVHGDGAAAMPYFAMELIPKAHSLAEHVSVRQMQLKDRLELFAKVCDAVQHGHQKGIVHRDLKPGNILVGSDNEPKIIDFGVARATDADVLLTTQCTQAGDLIGTIRYMSPEQCDGDSSHIDTRSDIYSLGVVLYELLTGIAPYDTSGTTVYAAVRVIKDEPPRRPSDANRALRGDLDAILLKALEKDPARRYASAADLAQDIRRHLAHEPIEARPPSVVTRAIKWAVRHPLTVSVCASAVVLALAAVIGGTGYWYAISRPDRVEVNADGSRAQLLTWAGNPLRTWSAGPDEIRFHLFTPRPESLGGGPLVLLGTFGGETDWRRGGVWAFDCRGKEGDPPVCWQLEKDQIPVEKIHARRGSNDYCWEPECFVATTGIMADVFDDPPGVEAKELVCYIKQQYVTHGAICIFRLDGKMLYRIWIEADLMAFHWAADPAVLVCYGANGEAFVEDRQVENARTRELKHPRVVFGIRPMLNRFVDDYLIQEPAERAGASPELLPLWYHCILPLDAGHPQAHFPRREKVLHTPKEQRYAKSAVLVTVYAAAREGHSVPDIPCTKQWLVDAQSGETIDTSPQNDSYGRFGSPKDAPNSKPLPPFDDWTLGELPAKKAKKSPS